MSVVENDPLADVLQQVSTWSSAQRITLARRILESLKARTVSEPPRARSLRDLVGLLKSNSPPPSDVGCKNILEDELINKCSK